MNYYRHFMGDYARDTQGLTLVEHGAYRRLLDAYYAADGNLEGSPERTNLVCVSRTKTERAAVAFVVSKYFTVDANGKLVHERADSEIAHGLRAISAARKNGRNGGRPKNPVGTPAETQREPSGKAPHPPSPIQLPIQLQTTSAGKTQRVSKDRPKETWLTAPSEAWDAINGKGSFPFGKAARALAPLHKAGHTPERIAAHLTYYLESFGDLKAHLKPAAERGWGGFKPDLARFAETFEQWNPEATV